LNPELFQRPIACCGLWSPEYPDRTEREFKMLTDAGYIAAKRTGSGTSEFIRKSDPTAEEHWSFHGSRAGDAGSSLRFSICAGLVASLYARRTQSVEIGVGLLPGHAFLRPTHRPRRPTGRNGRREAKDLATKQLAQITTAGVGLF
jgi:hypothetical protein